MCSACAGDYENPDRTAPEPDPAASGSSQTELNRVSEFYAGQGAEPGTPVEVLPRSPLKQAEELRAATNEQAAAKVGLFGGPGAGKTMTAALLAIGLAKTYHHAAPVAMHDTENGSDYLAPLFRIEDVPLLVHKRRAFAGLMRALDEAERDGCCALIVDSVTHAWNDLAESCRAGRQISRLDFHHWQDIKLEWRAWVDRCLNSPLHCLIAARAGHEYELQEDEEGRRELVRGASKMKAEGAFGYEPSLLVEMEVTRDAASPRRRASRGLHCARVLKDRARLLQGRCFAYRDVRVYKPGIWRRVFRDFAPHFESLNLKARQRALEPGSSAELFESSPANEASRRRQSKVIALEEIENTLVLLWPGHDGRSKRSRLLVLEALFALRSWTAIAALPLEELERGLAALRAFERRLAPGALESDADALALLAAAKEEKA